MQFSNRNFCEITTFLKHETFLVKNGDLVDKVIFESQFLVLTP